jgi:uncharacterized protein YecT (DUF1311 family)
MRILWMSLVLSVCAVAPASAQEKEFEWVFDEEYEFLESHDPGVLVLKNSAGEQSTLDFGYTGLTYDVVKTWPKGKTIRLVYSPERETEVLDPASGDRYPISGAWPQIDALLARCQSENWTNVGRLDCDRAALVAWDLELNRAYQRLMKSGLSDETKTAIRKAQREWMGYREASLAALRAYGSEGGGAVRRLETSRSAVRLTKDQAGLLLLYDAPPSVEAATE